jgi:hypothetical protein
MNGRRREGGVEGLGEMFEAKVLLRMLAFEGDLAAERDIKVLHL